MERLLELPGRVGAGDGGQMLQEDRRRVHGLFRHRDHQPVHRRAANAMLEIEKQQGSLAIELDAVRAAMPHHRTRILRRVALRSEARTVGKECVSTCRTLWSAYH